MNKETKKIKALSDWLPNDFKPLEQDKNKQDLTHLKPTDYDIIKADLSEIKDIFPNKSIKEILREIKDKENPSTTLTAEQEYKLNTYDSLLAERNQYKKERDRLLEDRELTKKSSNSSRLADEIQKKIDAAYRANSVEKGQHINLMNNLLAWEFSDNQERKRIIKEKKSEIERVLRKLNN